MNIKINTRTKTLVLLDVHSAKELLSVYNFLKQLDDWEEYKITSEHSQPAGPTIKNPFEGTGQPIKPPYGYPTVIY